MNAVAARIYALVLLPVVVAAVLFAVRGHDEVSGPSVTIGGRTFSVERAATDEARRKGLSDRDGICGHCGMVFLFDRPGLQGFWMKDMRFAIDIAWIREGRIVHIAREVPADHGGIIFPGHESDTVFETNAGALSSAEVGDAVVMTGVR